MDRSTRDGRLEMARCASLVLLMGMLHGCLTPPGVVGPVESDAVAWKQYTAELRSSEGEPRGLWVAKALVNIGNAVVRHW